MKKIILLLIAALALLVVAQVVIVYAPRLQQKSLPAGESAATQITVGHLYDSSPSYRVNAQYPQFGVPQIDAQVKSRVEKAVQEFEALPANPPDSAAAQSEFNGSFDKVYAGPDIISTELILYQYTGGAHGNTAFVGMNFERASGKALTLDDALALTGLTLDQVAASSTAQLSQKLTDAFFADGAKPTAENYGSFVVSADKVTFIFQLYQVAPYAAGPQEISFPRIK